MTPTSVRYFLPRLINYCVRRFYSAISRDPKGGHAVNSDVHKMQRGIYFRKQVMYHADAVHNMGLNSCVRLIKHGFGS